MDEQVGLPHLVEGGFEGVDEVGGQFADESHGVGEQEGQIVDDLLRDRRVEGGKEFVLGKDLALGEQVHECALAHVGIAHECHANHASAVFALGGFLLVNLGEPLFQQGDALQDDTAVHLQLGLARSAQSHASLAAAATGAAALTFEVGPEPLQSGQHISVLGQFHLGLGLGRLCAHGEDVENQTGAVENLHAEFLLDIADLFGRELIVEDDHTHFAFGFGFVEDILFDFSQFARPHVGHAAGTCQFLREPFHGDGSRRIGEKLQFVEIFLGLGLVLVLRHQSHEYGGFGFGFGNHKFFHAVLSLFDGYRLMDAGMVWHCWQNDASNCPAKITKSVGIKEFFAIFLSSCESYLFFFFLFLKPR